MDTHPIHFHLYDVQVLNRVTWDNIIIPPDATELGWKDTVRVSPLEDTIVALRPIIPTLPFELPNSIRALNPMMPLGDTIGFNNIDAAGNPTDPIVNQLVNFGWEYVYHCHILSHEEMDMMRPVSVALPPNHRTDSHTRSAGTATTEPDPDLERQLDQRDGVHGPAEEWRLAAGLTWERLPRRWISRNTQGKCVPTPTPRISRTRYLPVPGRGEEHRRLRRPVHEPDRPVGVCASDRG